VLNYRDFFVIIILLYQYVRVKDNIRNWLIPQ